LYTGGVGGALTQASVTPAGGLGFTATGSVLGDGDYWIKTTSPNQGSDFSVKYYDSAASSFVDVDAPLARTRDDALALYGNNPQAGDLFVHYDMNNELTDDNNFSANSRAEFSIMRHNGTGTTVATGAVENPTVTIGSGLTINGTTVSFDNELDITAAADAGGGQVTISTDNTYGLAENDQVTIAGTTSYNGTFTATNVTTTSFEITDTFVATETGTWTTGDDLSLLEGSGSLGIVGAINAANLTNITATVSSSNQLVLTHGTGLDITLVDATGTPIAELGLTSTIGTTNGYVHSNWEYLSYEAASDEPTDATPDGTLWYSTSLQVDLLENNGLGQWDEVTGTIYLQPAEPTTGLSAGDFWVDSDQLDDYPVISKYSGTEWVQIDNTDQTTVNGILFRDARPTPTFGTDSGLNNGATPYQSGFPDLDADAPDPLLYPRGTILFNTRYSTYNVKRWDSAYTVDGVLVGGRWVTESGNKEDGSPYMGDAAVREVIVERMQSVITNNEELRAESLFYNLLAAPGYPEMIDELVDLNTQRKFTGFVIGDTPFELAPNSTDLQNWAQNANNAPTTGADGLVNSDTYLGVYYPSGITTNVDGENVMVPASHMILRTMAFNDQVAYQWFAPAGYQRGIVTNATNVGYLTSEDEFEAVELSQGLRDVLYTNKINPIAFRPNQGLVVFGQKSRHATTSALDRINVVRLINYIRYQAPFLAEPFLFEPNDEITRAAVKEVFNRFLEELITLRGLYDFLVVCDDSNNTPARIDRNELWIDLLIQPVKAVEFIYIPVRVRNTGSDLTLAS
jgi:hypothetical protein